jgi:DNA-directed RNA polymerase specialized sigma subunit
VINQQLNEARKYEESRKHYNSKMIMHMRYRNYLIFKAFEAGARQKEIANALGLSESRVKKIIAEMRTK